MPLGSFVGFMLGVEVVCDIVGKPTGKLVAGLAESVGDSATGFKVGPSLGISAVCINADGFGVARAAAGIEVDSPLEG